MYKYVLTTFFVWVCRLILIVQYPKRIFEMPAMHTMLICKRQTYVLEAFRMHIPLVG